MNFRPATPNEEKVLQAITAAALAVHKELGSGLIEKVYEVCMAHLLIQSKFDVKQNFPVPIIFRGQTMEAGLVTNLIVNSTVIVEIKAADENNDQWERQMFSYLKLTGLKVGIIVNFNSANLARNGITRYVL